MWKKKTLMFFWSVGRCKDVEKFQFMNVHSVHSWNLALFAIDRALEHAGEDCKVMPTFPDWCRISPLKKELPFPKISRLPVVGGNQRMQMYGKFIRIFLIIVYCLGWCPPITPVSIPKWPDLSIHVGCMEWGGPLATTPTPVVAPEPEPVQAAPTPPPPPPAPQVEAVFSGRSGIGRREFVDIKFIGSFSPRISRYRLM